jgi:O-6-methylguanine DNA methyltransferase
VAVTQVAYAVDGWGVGELWLEDGRVVWHELPHPSHVGRTLGSNPLVERIQAYFAGKEITLADVPVDLEHETPFLERCALALREIPRGEVVTYGELAALAGAPGAARAAGSFCARNRLCLFVPCHRVVSANGGTSGYRWGAARKKALLKRETRS